MSKLKPFDIEKALKGEPVCYRDGTLAELELFLSKNRINAHSTYPLLAIDRNGTLNRYTKTGRFWENDQASAEDLFMSPVKVKYYFASWRTGTETPFRRQASPMYLSMDLLESDLHAATFLYHGFTIHEIEIEE
jgi:hypothetical protein